MQRPAARCLVLVLTVLSVAGGAAPVARAQEGDPPSGSQGLDEEARALFTAGSTAFDNARYEEALGYFQRAYELSHRSALLYNIGIAADRLRRDREALGAFEQFLEETPEHPRRRDVEVRVEVLRRAVADAEARGEAPSGEEPPPDGSAEPGGGGQETLPPPDREGSGGGTPVVLPIALGAAGLAGVTAAILGVASADDCLTEEGGTCVEERKPAWVPVAVYGGLGLAAVAGAVLWLVLGGGEDTEGSAPTVSARGAGLDLGWSF